MKECQNYLTKDDYEFNFSKNYRKKDFEEQLLNEFLGNEVTSILRKNKLSENLTLTKEKIKIKRKI